ncbi:hypothetical protein D3C73_1337380 [compost metagenome]
MEAAFHHDNPAAFDHADQQLAFMPFYCGDWEMRDSIVGNYDFICNQIGQNAQTGAENQADFRSYRTLIFNISYCFLNMVLSHCHDLLPP